MAASPAAASAALLPLLPARGVLAVALLAAVVPACRTRFAPERVPVSEASVGEATRVLHEAAAQRDDLELAEGGLLMDVRFYVWREWEVWEDGDELLRPGQPHRPPERRVERVRVLAAPRRVYVPLESLRAVHVRAWTLGTGIELDLAGEPEPAFLETRDRDAAERLASALDVLRRAATPEDAEPPAPGP